MGSAESLALSSYPWDIIPLAVLSKDAVAIESAVTSSADMAGHAYRAYLTEKREKKVVVVRPDGVADAIVRNAVSSRRSLCRVWIKDQRTVVPPFVYNGIHK